MQQCCWKYSFSSSIATDIAAFFSGSLSKGEGSVTTPITYGQLDRMAAEVLPERTVLSAVIMSGCTVSNSYTNPGVLGLLAPQAYAGPIQTMSCVPTAIA